MSVIGSRRSTGPWWKTSIQALALSLCVSGVTVGAAQSQAPAGSTGSGAREEILSTAEPTHPFSPAASMEPARSHDADYRLGPNDVLSVSVLQAPELDTSTRVSQEGEISLPLLGAVRAAGLTTPQLELAIESRLREKYIREPDVNVQLTDLQSQPVSVMGAVNEPGVFQMRGSQTLLEVLSLAGGLAPDAGDTVIVVRNDPTRATSEFATDAAAGRLASGAAPAADDATPAVLEVKLTALLDAPDERVNVAIDPGDVVTVRSAPIVYIVGAVKKPGSFAMRGNERMTVLQAVALGEGMTPTADKDGAVVLRTAEHGERVEIAVDLDAILEGQQPDVLLQAQDVLFVPNSGKRIAARAAVDTLLRVLSFRVFP